MNFVGLRLILMLETLQNVFVMFTILFYHAINIVSLSIQFFTFAENSGKSVQEHYELLFESPVCKSINERIYSTAGENKYGL